MQFYKRTKTRLVNGVSALILSSVALGAFLGFILSNPKHS